MSAFASKKFNSANYRRLRPTYPKEFFTFLRSYTGPVNLAVDIGCGPGESTKEIAHFANTVVGIDPSEVMIHEAKSSTQAMNVEYVVGSEDTLDVELKPGSVGLLASAEAAHWFKFPEFFAKAATVLKPGGTLAIWGYCDFVVQNQPSAVTDLFLQYAYDDKYLGSYWEAGRYTLRDLYKSLLPLPDDFTDVVYHTFRGDLDSAEVEPLKITQTVTVAEVLDYVRTYSAYHHWHEEHPDTTPANDIISDLQKDLAMHNLQPNDKITISYITVYLLAHRTFDGAK